MLGQSPCLGPIETNSQLHPFLNNPQTEDLGNRLADEHFIRRFSFWRNRPQKSMALRGSFGWECRKIAKELTRRRRPTKCEAWCRTACLWSASGGISVVSQLLLILNNPRLQTSPSGQLTMTFTLHLPFIGTPQKSMTTRVNFGWECMKIVNRQAVSAIRRPSAGAFLQYQRQLLFPSPTG
jgi:hypothetical protein